MTINSIRGLRFIPDLLKLDQMEAVREKGIALQKKILNSSLTANLRGCTTYLSQQHNLKTDERYRHVHLEDESGAKINGQFFERYGDDGHQLTYFIGNQNLPKFIKDDLIPRIKALPEVSAMGGKLNWNFTFNTYALKGNDTMAGFDFHKDIASNGEISLIYSLGEPAIFHIRHPQQRELMMQTRILSNSLILLSNEARWDYEHRVVPVPVEYKIEGIRRISMVLGVKNMN